MPVAAQMPMPVVMAQPVQNVEITREMLAMIGTPDAQKQYLGENLYSRVMSYDQARAGRVVGMILDAYTTDQIIENLRNESNLKVTVDRAIMTICEHEKTAQAAATA